jgi:hypothetical protein
MWLSFSDYFWLKLFVGRYDERSMASGTGNFRYSQMRLGWENCSGPKDHARNSVHSSDDADDIPAR